MNNRTIKEERTGEPHFANASLHTARNCGRLGLLDFKTVQCIITTVVCPLDFLTWYLPVLGQATTEDSLPAEFIVLLREYI